VTPALAAEIGDNLFDGHPAAAPLMLEAIHGDTVERRERSRLALRLLDPEEPLDYLRAPEGPAWQAALAIAYSLVASASASRQDRARVAGLLTSLCLEAVRIRERESAAA